MTAEAAWHFKSKPRRDGSGYIAWCAQTPDLRDGPMSVDWAEEVHFEFGASEQEAIEKLKRKVFS